jgi:hypothetical protein
LLVSKPFWGEHAGRFDFVEASGFYFPEALNARSLNCRQGAIGRTAASHGVDCPQHDLGLRGVLRGDSQQIQRGRTANVQLDLLSLALVNKVGITLHAGVSMLHNIAMSQGNSGRFVLETDPALKKRLYAALRRDGHTLKSWFLMRAAEYLNAQKSGSRGDRITKQDAAHQSGVGSHRALPAPSGGRKYRRG